MKDGSITVGQESYVKGMLREFGLSVRTAAETPVESKEEVVVPNPGSAQEVQEAQRMVGSLVWVSVHSRPDMTCSVCLAAALIQVSPSAAICRFKRVMVLGWQL